MAEIEPIKESKEFDEIRPKQSDPKLKAIFDELNKTVYNGKIPEIPIDWVENNVGIKGAMGGYCMDPENIMHVERSCILISKDIMDRVLRNCICHEMLHCRCHMQDVKRGVEVTSKKSNSHGNGNHNGLWKRLATLINKNHGIRIDQYYVDTTKSALKAAHQEWFRDDGEEYAGESFQDRKQHANACRLVAVCPRLLDDLHERVLKALGVADFLFLHGP